MKPEEVKASRGIVTFTKSWISSGMKESPDVMAVKVNDYITNLTAV